MEREYTVGALLVLVTIFVITLIIFFTIPEFSQSVKQIADEVFGTLQKEKEMQTEMYQRDEAIKVFESVKNCINQLKEKKDACTCYLESRNLPEGYYISSTEDKQFIKLGKGEGRIIVEQTQPFSIKDINFCILKKGLTSYDSIPLFVISSKGEKLGSMIRSLSKTRQGFTTSKKATRQAYALLRKG